MATRMGSRKARDSIADVVGRAYYGGEITIIERSGRPMAAVIPIDMYERLVAEREARFQVIERIRAHIPDVPADQVEKDVAEAVEALRASRAARRP